MDESNYRSIRRCKLLKDFRKCLMMDKTFVRQFIDYGMNWEFQLHHWRKHTKEAKVISQLLNNSSKVILIRDIWDCCDSLCWLELEREEKIPILKRRTELFARLEEVSLK
jgi:hypothetical protein